MEENVDADDLAQVFCAVIANVVLFVPMSVVYFYLSEGHWKIFCTRPWTMGDSGFLFAIFAGHVLWVTGIVSRLRRFRALSVRKNLFAMALVVALVIMGMCVLDYTTHEFGIYGYTRASILRFIFACFLLGFLIAVSWPLYFGWSKRCFVLCVFSFGLACTCVGMALAWNTADDFPQELDSGEWQEQTLSQNDPNCRFTGKRAPVMPSILRGYLPKV